MASTSTSKHSVRVDNNNTTTTCNSYFQKTICLKDWWLVKTEKDFEGKRLAVAGITSREKQAMRVFTSAPILKRYDVFNLETVDGICVIIEGFMNKARTEENGFPSEVCNHFVFGFPPYWEIYASKCSEGESTLIDAAQSNPDFERLSLQAGSSTKGVSRNFDIACTEAETQGYSNKKNLGVKSSSKRREKETRHNSKDEVAKSDIALSGSGGSRKGMSKNFDMACTEAETHEYSNKRNLGIKSSAKGHKMEIRHNSKDEVAKSDMALSGTGGSSKGTSKNFDIACTEAETQEYGNKNNLRVKSCSKGSRKETRHNLKDEVAKSDMALSGTGGSSKGMSKNFDSACTGAETEKHSNKKNLRVKSSSKVRKNETGHNSKDEVANSAFDSNVYPVCPGVSERETSLRDSSVENRNILELSENHFGKSIAKPLRPLGFEENSVASSIKRNANDTETENYGGRKCGLKKLQDHYKNSPLSACRLTKERGCNSTVPSLEHPSKVNSSKKLAKREIFSREADLSGEPSSHSAGRGKTCPEKKAKGKFKGNQMFCDNFKDVKTMSVSVPLRGSDAVGNATANLDDGSRRKSTVNPPGTEFQELTDEITSRNSDAGSFEDNDELYHRISLADKDAKQDQNHEGVQENGRMQNKTDGYLYSRGAQGDTGKKKKKIASSKQSNSQSKSPSARKSRRKLDGPISQKEKEESSVVSPQSLSLKRSRSGRWLLPSLEFWRNQRVIYDADHQITGIKDLH